MCCEYCLIVVGGVQYRHIVVSGRKEVCTYVHTYIHTYTHTHTHTHTYTHIHTYIHTYIHGFPFPPANGPFRTAYIMDNSCLCPGLFWWKPNSIVSGGEVIVVKSASRHMVNCGRIILPR